MTFRAKYDTEDIELSQGYIAALCNYMREFLAMMRKEDRRYADSWAWGVCRLGDLAMSNPDFKWGGEEDKSEAINGEEIDVAILLPDGCWVSVAGEPRVVADLPHKDIVMLGYLRAELSEGQASRLLEYDRLTFRTQLGEWLKGLMNDAPVPVEGYN